MPIYARTQTGIVPQLIEKYERFTEFCRSVWDSSFIPSEWADDAVEITKRPNQFWAMIIRDGIKKAIDDGVHRFYGVKFLDMRRVTADYSSGYSGVVAMLNDGNAASDYYLQWDNDMFDALDIGDTTGATPKLTGEDGVHHHEAIYHELDAILDELVMTVTATGWALNTSGRGGIGYSDVSLADAKSDAISNEAAGTATNFPFGESYVEVWFGTWDAKYKINYVEAFSIVDTDTSQVSSIKMAWKWVAPMVGDFTPIQADPSNMGHSGVPESANTWGMVEPDANDRFPIGRDAAGPGQWPSDPVGDEDANAIGYTPENWGVDKVFMSVVDFSE